ncbi:sigma-70 family RNA polymerase sigma factor, partial [Glutamicibacter sp. AGC46]
MTIDSGARFTEVGDADLIRGVRTGSREAQDHLYRRHKQVALNVAFRHTNSPSDAEDVVSEAFLRVFRIIERGAGPDEFFRAYLMTAVSREAFSRNKSATKQIAVEDVQEFLPGDAHADKAMERHESNFAIAAFNALTERWKTVLWLTEVEELPPRDVAPILGMTPNAVSALAVRAREGLREAYLAAHMNGQSGVPANCADIREHLPAFIRGTLGIRNERDVKEHLKSCPNCAVVFGELNEIGATLRAYVLPLFVGGITALGIPASGGIAGMGFSAASATVSAGATAGTASADASGAGLSITGGSSLAVTLGIGLVSVAVTASAIGLIPKLIVQEERERAAPSSADQTQPQVQGVEAPIAGAQPPVVMSRAMFLRDMIGQIVPDAKDDPAITNQVESPFSNLFVPLTHVPAAMPSPEDISESTFDSTPEPTPEPTVEPTPELTVEPTVEQTPEPTPEPTVEPTPELTVEPTVEQTPEPTPEPTVEPTPELTVEPTVEQTPEPTPEPTVEPTPELTVEPTVEQTPEPTPEPTVEPTPELTVEPTVEQTPEPTPEPTVEPTPELTVEPTVEQTPEPTPDPTVEPTPELTVEPTVEQTPEPTPEPTVEPTPELTVEPT